MSIRSWPERSRPQRDRLGPATEEAAPMSRHVPRHQRWSRHGPNEYRFGGAVVRYERGAWWAELAYRQLPPEHQADVPQVWAKHSDRLGPFKRPRNAMIAVEDR